jgi:hypothetical protein
MSPEDCVGATWHVRRHASTASELAFEHSAVAELVIFTREIGFKQDRMANSDRTIEPNM